MILLETLQSSSTPRSRAIGRRVRQELAPTRGFLICGAAWFFATLLASMVWLLWDMDESGASRTEMSGWIGLGIFAILWLPFMRWVWKTRQRAILVARKGELYEGSVSRSTGDAAVETASRFGFLLLGNWMSGRWYRVSFEVRGIRHFIRCPLDEPIERDALTVLFHPKCYYGIVFGADGSSVTGRVRR